MFLEKSKTLCSSELDYSFFDTAQLAGHKMCKMETSVLRLYTKTPLQ